MNAARANKIINSNLNGTYMKIVMRDKGWSKAQARAHLVDYVRAASKENISLYDYMAKQN